MFSPDLKRKIATEIQKILRETSHGELPMGEINFILHVDGVASWSWANIRNNGNHSISVFDELDRNLQFERD